MKLSKKQKTIFYSHDFIILVSKYTEIVYLIKKYKIEPYFSEIKTKRIPTSLWTKELIKKCADLCKNRKEFGNLFKTARIISIRDGYYETLMKDKPFWKDNFTKYSLKSILELCNKNKIKTYYDFCFQYKSQYQQSYQQGWLPVIKLFLEEKNKEKDIDAFLSEFKNVVNCITPRKLEKRIYKKQSKYTEDFLITKAKEFSNSRDLKKKYPAVYFALLNRCLIEKLFSNPLSKRYTDEELKNIALQYHTRKELIEKSSGVYWSLKNRGLLDSACSHMVKNEDSLGENLVRMAFNKKFNKNFYKVKPEWLINPKTGRRLELDGYNDELKIAFEVNGAYHYKHSKIEKLKDTQKKDRYKKKICKKMGIKLFVISYKTGRIEELYKQLSKILNTTKQELKILKVKNGVLLEPQEIKQKRKQYKIGKFFDVKKLSLQEQSLLINSLKKENMSQYKIAQMLNLTIHQIRHLITRLNAKGFKIIHR
jgi:hypothetical protein